MRREGIFHYCKYYSRNGKRVTPHEIALRVARNYARAIKTARKECEYHNSGTNPGSRMLWGKRLGAPETIYHHFNGKLLDMLCGCADESARRLLVFGFRETQV